MQKNMRRLIVSFLAVGMFFGFVLTVSAASSASGFLGSIPVSGLVTISPTNATAKTTVSAPPQESSTTTKLTYSYVNTQTNVITTKTVTEIGNNAAHANLNKPSQAFYRSYRATAAHTASHGGQKWTANTDIYY